MIGTVGPRRSAADLLPPSIGEITTAQIETNLSLSLGSTDAIDGLVYRNGNLLLLHRNSTANETIAALNPTTLAGVVLATDGSIATDLGSPFSSTMVFEGGFDATSDGANIYAAETFSGEYGLFGVANPSGNATLVRRDADIADGSDFALLNDTTMLIARGPDGVVAIDLASPGAPTTIVTEAELIALLPAPVADCPPESLAVDPVTGDVWLFCHEALEFFRIGDAGQVGQTIERVEIPGLTGFVDFHDMVIDDEGNLFGFDEAGEQIMSFDGTTVMSVPLTTIETALRGGSAPPLGVTLWRGMTVNATSANSTTLFLGSATSDYGIIRLTYQHTSGSAAKVDWTKFE